MARVPRVVVLRQAGGGGSAAGILLLFIAVAGLLALFTGNLERVVTGIAGPAGGAAGIYARGRSSAQLGAGSYGQPVAGPNLSTMPAGNRGPVPL